MLAVLAALAVSACGGSSAIEVERVAALPADAKTATFVVLPVKGQTKAKDYAKFADQIAGQMTAKGFSRVDTPAQARYALMFFYDGDGTAGASAEERRDSRSNENKIARTVSILLYDLTRPNRPDERVFGGRAHCTVEAADHDTQVVSALIDAIMKDFPGSARETYSMSLPSIK